MADPITVGGGGGLVNALADYEVDLTFDDTKYQTDGEGNYSRAGYKLASLKIQDFGGNLIVDCTPLLPDDRECEIVLRFKHGPERIYIRSKPIKISFDDDLWPKASGKRTRSTQSDRIQVDLGRGRWNKLELGTPRSGFQIEVESTPI